MQIATQTYTKITLTCYSAKDGPPVESGSRSPPPENVLRNRKNGNSKEEDDEDSVSQSFLISLGWFTDFSTEDVERAINNSLKKKVGETSWTLYAEEGSGLGWHEFVLSRSIPSGHYRLEYGEELPVAVKKNDKGPPKERVSKYTLTLTELRWGDNNILIVLLNFSLVFFLVIKAFAKVHHKLPELLSTCIGPASHKKAQTLHRCMRILEGRQNNTRHVDNLTQCALEGSVGGVFASICHWFRVEYGDANLFLFGFANPADLQILVYESAVSALCWGISYLWIRRGMNPETRSNYYSKYWKDAVYGSLAGFNATFMKGVLKRAVKSAAKSAVPS
ncbi:hypothetical protein TrCOL_g12968 [Triparma columacea]|uniref:Uncharacterized protein n=1 Tax=Triparma columacea TaxID=722753 RepID=A0A9W7GKW7_9STRA|nr:hypothetical protein TrCOL_g12968 [Triparma columacea]